MPKDDLRVEMERLEIASVKVISKNIKGENPFKSTTLSQSRKSGPFTKIMTKKSDICNTQKRKIYVNTICKKKNKNIIKEPVLKVLKDHSGCTKRGESMCKSEIGICPVCTMFNTESSLCTVINNCNELKISNCENRKNTKTQKCFVTDTLWWKTGCSNRKENKTSCNSQNQGGSCSQEALNPPCDVTIDELASYFETLVHIPKKMSTMAEMMYI